MMCVLYIKELYMIHMYKGSFTSLFIHCIYCLCGLEFSHFFFM